MDSKGNAETAERHPLGRASPAGEVGTLDTGGGTVKCGFFSFVPPPDPALISDCALDSKSNAYNKSTPVISPVYQGIWDCLRTWKRDVGVPRGPAGVSERYFRRDR